MRTLAKEAVVNRPMNSRGDTTRATPARPLARHTATERRRRSSAVGTVEEEGASSLRPAGPRRKQIARSDVRFLLHGRPPTNGYSDDTPRRFAASSDHLPGDADERVHRRHLEEIVAYSGGAVAFTFEPPYSLRLEVVTFGSVVVGWLEGSIDRKSVV